MKWIVSKKFGVAQFLKAPAREQAFQKTVLSPGLSAVVVAMIVLLIIMTVLPVVPALFPADVLAVNPVMPLGVARDPHHFIVAGPIAGAMVVEWPVADLD